MKPVTWIIDSRGDAIDASAMCEIKVGYGHWANVVFGLYAFADAHGEQVFKRIATADDESHARAIRDAIIDELTRGVSCVDLRVPGDETPAELELRRVAHDRLDEAGY